MTWVKTWEATVENDWLDELDHVNFLTHQRIADLAATAIWRDARGEGQDLEFVITETHVRYIRELRLGAGVEIRTALIAWDAKRFQFLHRIESEGALACAVETLNLCFDPATRRAANFTAAIAARFGRWPAPPGDARPQLSIDRKPYHG